MPSLPRILRRRTPEERTGSMTVIEHLEELRHRLVVSIIAIALGSVAGWFLYPHVLHLMQRPFCSYVAGLPSHLRPPTGCRLTTTGLLDPMLVKLKVVVFLGLALVLPVLLYQLWAFIVPGLTQRERRYAVPFIVASTLLFILGGLFAYVTLPKGLNFLLGFAGTDVTPLLQFSSYVSFVVLVTLAFGLSFEFPVILVFLLIAHVLTTRQLRDWRRYAAVIIVAFAAIITPSQDPYSLFAMAIPMYIFYEGSIIIGRILKR